MAGIRQLLSVRVLRRHVCEEFFRDWIATQAVAPTRRAANAPCGRPAVVTDDDVRAFAIADGSEREPGVGRNARNSSEAGASGVGAYALALAQEQ